MTLPHRTRRGAYSLMSVLGVIIALGIGALVIDLTLVAMARAQAQDVADAASLGGITVLRQTGDEDLALDAARAVVGANGIIGQPGELISLEFGSWDDTIPNPVFMPLASHPNAVRATVAREGGEGIPYMLSRIWGYERFGTRAVAVSAARSIQLAIVLDVTGSWGEADFLEARRAVLVAIDMLAASSTDVDEVAMTIFTNRYSWLYTPFTNIADSDAYAAVRADWEQLSIASKGGTDADPSDGISCVLKPWAQRDDFTNPAGGCYPAMPREYTDESGTDHSAGILLAQQVYEEASRGANYRAMIVLTDGRPNDLGAESGVQRAADGYTETRWRQYVGPVPRTQAQIRTASIEAADALWDDLHVHTWVVSLIEHDEFMPSMTQGDGYYVRTNRSEELGALIAQIMSEMPLALVQ